MLIENKKPVIDDCILFSDRVRFRGVNRADSGVHRNDYVMI